MNIAVPLAMLEHRESVTADELLCYYCRVQVETRWRMDGYAPCTQGNCAQHMCTPVTQQENHENSIEDSREREREIQIDSSQIYPQVQICRWVNFHEIFCFYFEDALITTALNRRLIWWSTS